MHLWVEGFFEVFATVVIAFLFARLKLVSLRTAGEASLLSSTIFLSGGIIGTVHHLYFSGTPTVVLALGSVFSALEVVPLLFVGYEAWHNIQLSRRTPWVRKYRWPIYFFVSVAFWNLVGAGLFGFMINPPIALYYMQGLNTTPVHGHAALFGVYGMLGIGLMLFSLRALRPEATWKERPLAFSFWAINVGLFAMVTLSLLPVGLMQTWASVNDGYWYARSSEFLQTDLMQTLRWLRVIGDTIFAVGAFALVYFVFGLSAGYSIERARCGRATRARSRRRADAACGWRRAAGGVSRVAGRSRRPQAGSRLRLAVAPHLDEALQQAVAVDRRRGVEAVQLHESRAVDEQLPAEVDARVGDAGDAGARAEEQHVALLQLRQVVRRSPPARPRSTAGPRRAAARSRSGGTPS